MGRKQKMTRAGYAQFLLTSQTNYTLTYFAEHVSEISHDAINRYLAKEKLTPSLLWEHVKQEVVTNPSGYLIFDDTVLDKTSSHAIEIARWQYSGNAGKVIQGIGVVTCVYYNPQLQRYWAIDYRLYAPDQDGKSKIDHVQEMLKSAVHGKSLAFKTVLMDTWYTTNRLMHFIQDLGKTFYGTLKSNRLVSRVQTPYHYQPLTEIVWSSAEDSQGIRAHLKKSRQHFHLQLFRIAVCQSKVQTSYRQQSSDVAIYNAYGYKMDGFRAD
jgi:DDE superfamily endonuclease